LYLLNTDTQARRVYWNNQVIGLMNWKILDQYPTKRQAQDHENRYAKQTGCVAHAGGPDTPGTWYVYRFDYTRTR